MKVLHVGEYVQGGVATYLKTLFDHPEDNEVEDYLICSEKNSEHQWQFPVGHVKYYAYHRSVMQIVPAMMAVWRAIRSIQPDIIYCHSTWAGLFARLPMFLLGKPCKVIYNAHGWAFLRDTAEWKRQVFAFIERVLLLKTDVVINVSKYEYQAALSYGLSGKKQKVIYNGVSEKKEPIDPQVHLPKDKINLLFVGRFDPQKGVDYLLQEFAKCQRDDLHLTIIGDNVIGGGTPIEKKNTDRVTFLGWVPHDKLSNYYNACDVVIMPSHWEAFGLVAVEAMKYAKPVIVSNRGALPELVQDGANGYVFDFDNPETLQGIFQKLDKQKLKKMGMQGEHVFRERFTATRMGQKLKSCLVD